MVMQGFSQKPNVDYFDTYGPIVYIFTIKLLVSLASIYNLITNQMDIKTTFFKW